MGWVQTSKHNSKSVFQKISINLTTLSSKLNKKGREVEGIIIWESIRAEKPFTTVSRHEKKDKNGYLTKVRWFPVTAFKLWQHTSVQVMWLSIHCTSKNILYFFSIVGYYWWGKIARFKWVPVWDLMNLSVRPQLWL